MLRGGLTRFIRNGNLRVIAQVNEKRLQKYASIPTIKEAGFDVPYYAVFRGIVGPPQPRHHDHLHFDAAPWRYTWFRYDPS